MNRASHHEHTTALEACARETLSVRAGRRLTDEEWETAKHALIALFRLLKDAEPELTIPSNAPADTIPPNTTPPARSEVSLAIQPDTG